MPMWTAWTHHAPLGSVNWNSSSSIQFLFRKFWAEYSTQEIGDSPESSPGGQWAWCRGEQNTAYSGMSTLLTEPGSHCFEKETPEYQGLLSLPGSLIYFFSQLTKRFDVLAAKIHSVAASLSRLHFYVEVSLSHNHWKQTNLGMKLL